ncbi:MAG: trehalase family glycosidase [Verrucomicrobiota bacterium JB023]|nr:trehalase family glycosidase [Verrucomicrobiota bacterium JB023]
MPSIRHLISQCLSHLRMRSSGAARVATKFHRMTLYGFDLVLWSRLFGRKRGPVPIELTRHLLAEKSVKHKPPSLHLDASSDLADRWEEGFAAVYATLFLNLQKPDVLSDTRYAHPAPAFKGVYLWDSAFIAQVWKWWDNPTAMEVLDSVIRLRDGARLQHVVTDLTASSYTQPPLIAWSLHHLLRSPLSEPLEPARMQQLFGALSVYNKWLYEHRYHESGLFYWEHAYESGVENAPRFGNRTESDLIDTRRYAAPDLSGFMVVQNETLAELARKLDRKEEEQHYTEKADKLRQLINEKLWSEELGLYTDWEFDTGEQLKFRTIAGLIPLMAGVPDKGRAEHILKQVVAPKSFATPIPFPSVAADDPSFELDMWRGPVWLNTAYCAILGLQRYGFHREASELVWKLCDGVYATHAETRRLYEFYDPNQPGIDDLNRKRGNQWKKWTLGNKPRPEFVGWTGLVNSLVIECLFGLERDENGCCLLRPRFPAAAADIGFSIRLPALGLAIHIDVTDDTGSVRGTARRSGRRHTFEGEFGQAIPLDSLFPSPS